MSNHKVFNAQSFISKGYWLLIFLEFKIINIYMPFYPFIYTYIRIGEKTSNLSNLGNHAK